MAKLTDLFDEGRAELLARLADRPQVDRAVREMCGELDRLQGRWLVDLFEHQSRVAIPLLNLLRVGLEALTSAHSGRLVGAVAAAPAPSRSRLPWMLRGPWFAVVRGLLAFGLVVALVWMARDTIWALAGLAVVFSGAALEVWSSYERARREVPRGDVPGGATGPARVQVEVDPGELLDQFRRALHVIDGAVPEAEDRPTAKAPAPALAPSVLELLQAFVEDVKFDDAEVLLKRAKSIPALLRNLGIELVTYDASRWAEDPEGALELFDFEPSLSEGCGEPETLAPALVHGEQVLLRGRVKEPPS